jgi:hypothetical protein
MGIVTIVRIPKKFGHIGQTFRNLMVGQAFSDLVTCLKSLSESPINSISDTQIASAETICLDPPPA